MISQKQRAEIRARCATYSVIHSNAEAFAIDAHKDILTLLDALEQAEARAEQVERERDVIIKVLLVQGPASSSDRGFLYRCPDGDRRPTGEAMEAWREYARQEARGEGEA